MRAALALLCGLVLMAGCGVEPQSSPQPLTLPSPQLSQPGQRSGDVGIELTVYFVRGAALAPAQRRVDLLSPAASLDALIAGPTRAEVIAGLRTALAPQALTVDVGLPGGITSVAVTTEFTGVTGANQLLAVAQVVWTLTGVEGTQQVRFLLDGAPVEVPTDTGLTDAPVGRDDFDSVTPAQNTEPAGDD